MRRAIKVLAEKFEQQFQKDTGLVWSGSRKQLYRWFQDRLRERLVEPPQRL